MSDSLAIGARILSALCYALSALAVSKIDVSVLVESWLFCFARLCVSFILCQCCYQEKEVNKQQIKHMESFEEKNVPRTWHILLLLASIIYTSYSILFIVAIEHLPLSLAITLVYLSPMISINIEAIIAKKFIPYTKIVVILVSLTGIFLIYPPWKSSTSSSSSTLLGLICALSAALLGGFVPFINNQLAHHGISWRFQAFFISLLATFFFLPLATIILYFSFHDTSTALFSISFDSSNQQLTLLYAVGAAFANSIAFSFLILAYSSAHDPVKSAIAGYIEIPFAILLQVFFQHTSPSEFQYIGIFLITFASCLLLSYDHFLGSYNPLALLSLLSLASFSSPISSEKEDIALLDSRIR